MTDWSLASALFHWHRFNGINNEYKRRGIPTPYLWSGSQHYRKGKYVADHKFDPEAVSKQVGAAVLLKALVDLGAVNLTPKGKVAANPAASTGDASSLTIDTRGAAFKKVAAEELDFPRPAWPRRRRNKAEQANVRRVQEWLNIHDRVTPIDGDLAIPPKTS